VHAYILRVPTTSMKGSLVHRSLSSGRAIAVMTTGGREQPRRLDLTPDGAAAPAAGPSPVRGVGSGGVRAAAAAQKDLIIPVVPGKLNRYGKFIKRLNRLDSWMKA
jgi:hypothetical protein